MPIFEYHCQNCGKDCEILVRGQHAPICPECQSRKLEKLMSAPAGHVAGRALPMASSCPPPDAPLCGPACCRIPQ